MFSGDSNQSRSKSKGKLPFPPRTALFVRCHQRLQEGGIDDSKSANRPLRETTCTANATPSQACRRRLATLRSQFRRRSQSNRATSNETPSAGTHGKKEPPTSAASALSHCRWNNRCQTQSPDSPQSIDPHAIAPEAIAPVRHDPGPRYCHQAPPEAEPGPREDTDDAHRITSCERAQPSIQTL